MHRLPAVVIAGAGLTWKAAPGAHENIVANVPAEPGGLGESAYTIRHEFHAGFLSQTEGFPDSRVSHRIRQVLGPDLEFRHDEFIPFSAECLGPGK